MSPAPVEPSPPEGPSRRLDAAAPAGDHRTDAGATRRPKVDRRRKSGHEQAVWDRHSEAELARKVGIVHSANILVFSCFIVALLGILLVLLTARSRVNETVRCPSVCLSVSARLDLPHSSKPAAAGLLLCAPLAGYIDRLLQ